MKKSIIFIMYRFLTILLMVVSLSIADNDRKTVQISDMKGNDITIPSDVQRVAVNGALAQMVLMLGCGDRIVATGSSIVSNPMLIKVYPKIKSIPVLFGAPGGKSEVNKEMLMKIQPDILFGDIAAVSALGVPTLAVSMQNFDDIKKTILMVGRVFGTDAEKTAIGFCNYYDSTITAVGNRTATVAFGNRPKIFYGGGDGGLSTEGKNEIASSWIETAGGRNIAAEYNISGKKTVSIEDVVQWDPEIIIATSINGYKTIVTSGRWKTIKAVKEKKVYLSPKGVYLWSVRSAEGVLQIPWAAKKIHPELFEDLDMKTIVGEFYRRFYRYEISDGDMEMILNQN